MNIYLEKIAATVSKKEQEEAETRAALQRGAGAAAVIGGGQFAHHQYARGNLTGRETLYHGTSNNRAKNILEHGLKPGAGNGVSDAVGIAGMNKDKVFLEHRKVLARQYADQQHALEQDALKGIPHNLGALRPDVRQARVAKSLVPGLTEGSVLKANVPTWHPGMAGVENPEYAHLRDNSLYRLMNGVPEGKRGDNMLHNLLQKHVHVHESLEGLSPKYFTKSKHYNPNSLAEVREFIKANPGRFAKGVGKAALGVAAIGGGGYLFNKGLAHNAEDSRD